MYAIRIGDVAGYTAPPPYARELKVLLSPTLHDLRNVAVGVMTLPAGGSGGTHKHHETEEIWYIISGCGQVRVGEEVRTVEPGMVIMGPPGIPHGFVNNGSEPLQALWIISPAGDEQPILDGLATQRKAQGA